MWCQGDAQGISCSDLNYDRFDKICKQELALPITVDTIINKSSFCSSIPLGILEEMGENFFTISNYIEGLKGKMGIYNLWVDTTVYCDDHKNYLLACAYVGKGQVHNRIKSHLKKKWPDTLTLYVSFYECEHRIAIYLEQLFLDTYDFTLNIKDNNGKGILYAKWNDERYDLGTEFNEMVDLIDLKFME